MSQSQLLGRIQQGLQQAHRVISRINELIEDHNETIEDNSLKLPMVQAPEVGRVYGEVERIGVMTVPSRRAA